MVSPEKSRKICPAAYIQVFENGRLTVVLLGRDVLAVVVAELREAVAAVVVPAV